MWNTSTWRKAINNVYETDLQPGVFVEASTHPRACSRNSVGNIRYRSDRRPQRTAAIADTVTPRTRHYRISSAQPTLK